MCWLVAGLYCFSGVVMWVAIKYIYNLDKATLEIMTKELAERKAAQA